MLKNTFCHISGVGLKTERRLWNAGIFDWESFLHRCPDTLPFPQKELIKKSLEKSFSCLENRDAAHFDSLLPPALHWRFFPEFRARTAYLDIETTGLDFFCEITAIALYDGKTVHYYVNGQNLEDFIDDILKYDVIVTYNGKCFDIPFLEKFFKIKITQPHMDLRYILKSLGFSGGLKRCETLLGIDRGNLKGVDGFMAVRLWEDYVRHNNAKALETLLAYNIEDAVNLEKLMVAAYNMKIADTPFSLSNRLPDPACPPIPFQADRETVERLAVNRSLDSSFLPSV
jgi:uncharacterized protein